MTSNISIAIMAAGASSRMGSPKQLLKWGEYNLLGHTIRTALDSIASEVVIVLGAYNELIENEIKHHPVTIINNKNWNLGLGKSIACAAEYILKRKPKTQGLLVVLADQPLIDTDYLNELIHSFSPNQNEIIASIYDNNKKGVPVLFDKLYFEELSNLDDDSGAKKLLVIHESFVKTLKPPVKNVDLDSKEDYKTLYKANFNSK